MTGFVSIAQVQTSTRFSIPLKGHFDPATVDSLDFPVDLYTIEAPSPDGPSMRSELLRRKQAQGARFPRKHRTSAPASTAKAPSDSVDVVDGRLLFRQAGPITVYLSGSIPSDNTLALSKDGILATAYNSALVVQNAQTGADLFPNTFVGLGLIALEFATGQSNFFDPKLLYDPLRDRFILVFLRDNTPQRSLVIVAFSQTNDPSGAWNTYALPGDPLNDSIWTDYPALALSQSELFITGNRVLPGQPWQTGFNGSMIWQIGLDEGYAGADSLDARLWSGVQHNGRFLRNLCPVQHGGVPDAEGIYLLSNRNFDAVNDTTFLVHLTGNRNNPSTQLTTEAWVADSAYGLAPNAKQSDSDTTNPASGFDTNDSRVLGAIQIGAEIQFVGNSIRFQTGLPGVYHGVMNLEEHRLTARVLGHPQLELGYPNIAWTGSETCQPQSLIAFNTTSPTDFAGTAAIEYRNERSYSALTPINTGFDYVDRQTGLSERWGDYFGIQRDFNRPGRVYTAGYHGLIGGNNGIYVAQLASADSLAFDMEVVLEGVSAFCEARVQAVPAGGKPPYTFQFDGVDVGGQSWSDGYCPGDSVEVTATDAYGCTETQKIRVDFDSALPRPSVFPNPFNDRFSARFELMSGAEVEALLFDAQGHLIRRLVDRALDAGTFEIGFHTTSLRAGTYVFLLKVNGADLTTETLIKPY
ncbi:hypothetical protein GC167_06670 [bacterium]|nr:hypothetical protein [bacterium]